MNIEKEVQRLMDIEAIKDLKTAPYCITRALINAATGDVDNGLLFCGSNAWRAQKIERTVDIMEEMA